MERSNSSTELATELLGLLRIPSVTTEENALADALETRFRAGLPASLDFVRVGDSLVVASPGVLAETGGAAQPASERAPDASLGQGSSVRLHRSPGARPLVVLAGHLDTVPIGDAWPPEVRGDRLFGRGACDMKAGLAVMLRLLDRLPPEAGFSDRAYVFYCGEEGPANGNDLPHVLAAVPSLARADLALLLEPTAGVLELGCQGSVHARVNFVGRPCHSARPWLGLHPLAAALPWLSRVLQLPARPVRMGGVEFHEVVTITQVHAGETRNVLPGRLEVNLNLRYPPDRTPEDAENYARSLCPSPRALTKPADAADRTPADLVGASRAAEVGTTVEIVDHARAGTIPLQAPLYRYLLECSDLPRRAKQAWTDVARFSALGVPALNWGPGDPRQAHTSDEDIEIAQLGEVYERMHQFLAGPGPQPGERRP